VTSNSNKQLLFSSHQQLISQLVLIYHRKNKRKNKFESFWRVLGKLVFLTFAYKSNEIDEKMMFTT